MFGSGAIYPHGRDEVCKALELARGKILSEDRIMPFNDPHPTAGKPYKINLADVPREPWRNGRFSSDDQYVDRCIRNDRLSLVVARLEPGAASCPFHFHHHSEELFYVLEGTGTLRYGAETGEVRAGDVIACPPGPDSAHQFINTGTTALVLMAVSIDERVDICEYPDSGKIAVHAVPRGEQAGIRGVYMREAKVDYFAGEDLGTPVPARP